MFSCLFGETVVRLSWGTRAGSMLLILAVYDSLLQLITELHQWVSLWQRVSENRNFIPIQSPLALLASKHDCLPANYLGLREVLHLRTYQSEPIFSPLAREIPPAPLERWPTVVFKLVTIEQANYYLMVYCHTGPTISTLAYTFVLPSLQFSASVGNINISLAYTGLPDGL